MATQEEKYQRRRLRNSYITSVISITLVLFLLGIQGLILIHAQKLSRYVREHITMTIVLKDGAKDADVARLQKQLDFLSAVKSTTFISKEQAATQLTEELGEEFVDFIGYNPLSASIELNLHADYANNDSMTVLEQQFLQLQDVQEVYYQKNLVEIINDNVRRISTGLLSMSAIILLIAITLINNTIRLSVYSKRLLIKTMQLVGATQGFIRKPFIRRGILQGLIGAGISSVGVGLTLSYLQAHIPELVTIKDIDWFLLLFAALFLVAVVFTWLSSFFAVRRFLRMGNERIHY
ncbi:MAG: permease-like cell division protein FtsX [Bacteroidales bacterium]|jgi:cell division transport system permease protein|nr:permease-like cell division protein FtsX [Bacteroidales bacterium]